MLVSTSEPILSPPRKDVKPQCPKEKAGGTTEAQHKVLVHAGHRDPHFAKYVCTSCNFVWEQKRPLHLADGEEPVIVERCVAGVNGASRTPSGGYTCGWCGMPKRGHVCPVRSALTSSGEACKTKRVRRSGGFYRKKPIKRVLLEVAALNEKDTVKLLAVMEKHDLRLSDVRRLQDFLKQSPIEEDVTQNIVAVAQRLCALGDATVTEDEDDAPVTEAEDADVQEA